MHHKGELSLKLQYWNYSTPDGKLWTCMSAEDDAGVMAVVCSDPGAMSWGVDTFGGAECEVAAALG